MKRVIEQLKNEVEEMKTAHQRELYSMKSLQETVFSQLSLFLRPAMQPRKMFIWLREQKMRKKTAMES